MMNKTKAMKTRVKIRMDYENAFFGKGSVGYVDGYVMGEDHAPHAVVICNEEIDLVPICCLKVIDE